MQATPDIRTECVNRTFPERLPCREIHFDYALAVRCLGFAENLAAAHTSNVTAARFCRELGDAIWLARWKREHVRMDVEIESIAQLISLTIDHQASGKSARASDTGDEFLTLLTQNNLPSS